MRHALLVVALWGLMCATVYGDPVDPDFVNCSQLPNMTSNGYDFSSETLVPSVVADDFQCTDPRPVTDIHWWGSYYTVSPGPYDINSDHHLDPSFPGPGLTPVMPNTLSGFIITFYTDVPAGVDPVMPYSHPGQPLVSCPVQMNQVQSNLHGVIDRNGNGIVGDDGDEAVWQYNLNLFDPFVQDPGTIYWLSIVALNGDPVQNPNSIQWGWHE